MSIKFIPTTWPSPAKLNLFLNINSRLDNGYHELQTLFQFVDLNDTLQFDIIKNSTKITVLPPITNLAQEDNLIFKAAKLLQQKTNCPHGAKITITKKIPLGGGLGGGSSNAATTLVALNYLWETNISNLDLQILGKTLGADVPIFIFGHSALASGIGEKLTKVILPEKWFLVIHPNINVATADIFNHPKLPRNTPKMDNKTLLNAKWRNDCENIVRSLHIEVDQALSWLLEYAPARLTGTGACIFAQFSSQEQALEVLNLMPNRWFGFVTQGNNNSLLAELLQHTNHHV